VIIFNEGKTLKEDQVLKYTKAIDIVPLLKEKKISSVEYTGQEVQFGYEGTGRYKFEWGGATILFVKGDYFLRIFIKSITSIEHDVSKHYLYINMKPGQYVRIVYE
jgi:hypothetical protein